MARKSKKHKEVVSVEIMLDGGLDKSEDERNIPDNAMTKCYNHIYDIGTKHLHARPGLEYVTNAIDPSGTLSEIKAMHFYVKDATDSWLVAAGDGNLYQMHFTVLEGSTPKWTLIGALTDANVYPSFLTFNGILLIADGHTSIRTWNGTTYGDLSSDSAPPATVLFEINNRVVANSKTDLDAVWFSGPEDETDWDTGSGSAEVVRAGFGDGLLVNGFASMRDLLVVSKVGQASSPTKKMWSIDTSGTPDNWYANYLSHTNAATNHSSITNMLNNVIFNDNNGVHNLQSIIEYGDINMDTKFGYRINREISTFDCLRTKFITQYAAVWMLFQGNKRIFAYHPHIGDNGAFTELGFSVKMADVEEAGENVFIASTTGYLYKLNRSIKTDELTSGNYTNIATEIRTKLFTFSGNKGILRYVQPNVTYTLSGQVIVGAYDRNLDTLYELGRIDLLALAAEQYLYDANEDLYDANQPLGQSAIYMGHVKQRFRNEAIMFVLKSISGTFGIANILVKLAIVNL